MFINVLLTSLHDICFFLVHFVKYSIGQSPTWIYQTVEPNSTCTFKFATESGFFLEIESFALIAGDICGHGHVKIWDGQTRNDQLLIGTYCKNMFNLKSVRTTGKHMLVEFYSHDDSFTFEVGIMSRKGQSFPCC